MAKSEKRWGGAAFALGAALAEDFAGVGLVAVTGAGSAFAEDVNAGMR